MSKASVCFDKSRGVWRRRRYLTSNRGGHREKIDGMIAAHRNSAAPGAELVRTDKVCGLPPDDLRQNPLSGMIAYVGRVEASDRFR